MATFVSDGLDGLLLAFDKISELPDSVADEMLIAEAEVVMAKQKATGQAMGVHDTGLALSSIKRKSPKKTKDGHSILLTFEGSRTRGRKTTRNAEIAFINEFGKRGQSPRPFIKTANEESMGRAAEAAERIYDAWLDSQGL